MEIESITAPPQLEDFILLSEHEEQTPGTFFGGKPVLHLHCPKAQLRTSKSETLADDAPEIARWLHSGDGGEEDMNTREVDAWVTSRTLVLFSPVSNSGAKISYSTITFHAQEGDAVLLGLNLSDPNTTPDEDIIFFHARLVPSEAEIPLSSSSSAGGEPSEGKEPQQERVNGNHDPLPAARKLFDAIAACQELNPDPPQAGGDSDDDGEGEGFDETAPGATGWITSENMADFMDEDGNFRLPEGVTVIGGDEGEDDQTNGLGEGAGIRRSAADMEGDGQGEEDETKWQRTED